MLLLYVYDERLSTKERCYHIFPSDATVFWSISETRTIKSYYSHFTLPIQPFANVTLFTFPYGINNIFKLSSIYHRVSFSSRFSCSSSITLRILYTSVFLAKNSSLAVSAMDRLFSRYVHNVFSPSCIFGVFCCQALRICGWTAYSFCSFFSAVSK